MVVELDAATEAGESDAFDRMVAERAELTGAEREAGSDDPAQQARVILEDSELRALEREASPTSAGERRSSDEATPPR